MLCVHYEVALNVFFHFFQLLAVCFDSKLVRDFAHPQNLSRMYINIRRLAAKATHRGLMD